MIHITSVDYIQRGHTVEIKNDRANGLTKENQIKWHCLNIYNSE
jgi:hypothetical protein